ncbi:hypothetical protein COS91_07055 [Candidatus Desantisbacteria bacterium CG07_land_8_20_14_0_80_39_15]|uniref:Neutral/alkaline non-lysosomal ceramidase N-terminal domain-containing protein n=1 Tax=Candidatus Desantisbacteria bacterium CG07_land_8_20_14_0_80_39_15 TaxID=1974549 RepID=A0A2M6ZEX2_9BACT|nr:MAG: hypothetical protein COS91_07055 [Candidatus Desantisbacteria bacterium CG07_land_8_20_14_0_80_39_15]
MFKAGVAKVKITPPLGVELWGYGIYLNRFAKGVNDELYAKAIEFYDGENKAIIISCDLGGLGRYFVQQCKEEISKSINIPKDNITICATHTHSGPSTVFMRGLGEIDKNYLNFLKEKIVQAAKKSDKDLEKIRIGTGKGEADIGYNRVVKDGIIDKELMVLKVENAVNKTKAILYNYSTHPVTGRGDNFLVSADWPGYASKKIERENKCISIFLQGSCGDIDVKNTGMFKKAKENGETVAQEVLKIQQNIKLKKDLKIKMKTKIINLSLNVPQEKDIGEILARYKKEIKNKNFKKFIQAWKKDILKEISKNPRDSLTTEIQVIQIGEDIVFVMHPSELFTKWGIKIKEISPYKSAFVVGYANDYIGYIPDEEDFKIGDGFRGYAAFRAPMYTGFFPFKENVGEILVQEIKELLRY